ncbi:MAG TPA: potassium channel family protein [Candidatus Omnitrophota bacterium]|nr:potassium channel family protein [Candidatus Omnitrophota bacterium]
MDFKTLNIIPSEPISKMESTIAMEREAHRLRAEGKIDQAFQAFERAAKKYQDLGEHRKAAACYASAAACWNIHTGWQPLRNAATRNELAAIQAFEAKDYAYTETLFHEAALLYEKEGDFRKYSYCYIRSQDARLMRLWKTFTQGSAGQGPEAIHLSGISFKERFLIFSKWFLGSLHGFIWGYGEKPFRVLGLAAGVIFFSALFYHFSGMILTGGFVQKIGFGESLYLSMITYTTVGYGDYLPMGWVRGIAAAEALSGILFTPLFLIAMARRYLRMS